MEVIKEDTLVISIKDLKKKQYNNIYQRLLDIKHLLKTELKSIGIDGSNVPLL